MFLPIGHEDLRTRRLPVVTFVLIGICVLVHVLLSLDSKADEVATRAVVTLATKYTMVKGLEAKGVCKRMVEQVGPGAMQLPSMDSLSKMTQPDLDKIDKAVTVTPDATEEDQAEFDTLCAQLHEALDALPVRRLGFVPASPHPTALVTNLFVHGGWLHLLGNVWFLFLVGMNLEDRWGRGIFAAFYFASGIVATLAQTLMSLGSDVPIIGASGAIAGVMGAFAVIFPKTQIRFAYILFSITPKTFAAPAWGALILWFLIEIFYGVTGIEAGVANWAHVGGFAIGAGVAFAAKRTGLDRRLDREVDRIAALGDDPRIDEANSLMKRGRAKDALVMLQGLAKEAPLNEDVIEALLQASKLAADREAIVFATKRLIEIHLDAERTTEAIALYEEAKASGVAAVFPQTTICDS